VLVNGNTSCAYANIITSACYIDRILRTHTRWEVILTGLMGILWLGENNSDCKRCIILLTVIFMLVLALILSLQPVPDVDCPDDANGDPSNCEHRRLAIHCLTLIGLWI
jgi:hypothetical protein